ncbi:MAG: hypothetical protein J6Q03_00170 [Paludibacteraceae bacterium]|nr:hypothetical protein [Paludibacteraceae bacterium]MBO6102672.1 hypothetical protein [Opitutales bacterium]MBO7144265.1 hypothetical protein [Salinivirgaceae bacterium]
MAGYEYNPLLKLNLQKKDDSATPGDIARLEGEIEALRGNVSDKVPKFFQSIEELEVGEIGQYQGETTADFVNGYFYKRQEPVAVEYGETQYTYQSTGYIEIKRGGTLTAKQLYVRQNEEHGYITFTTEQLILCRCASERNYAYVFLFSPDLLIGGDDLPTVTVDNNQYLLFPYVYDRTDVGDEFMDYDNPIQYLGNNTVKYLDYEPKVLYKSAWGISSFIGADLNDNSLLYAWFNNYGCFALPISSDCSQLAFNVLKALPPSDYYYEAETTQEITAYPTSFITQPPFVRVNAQPSLDPSDFATAAQGTKADTALQSISKGTDGNYITTTVTEKTNNEQTVAASLTIQDITTADNTHKGLAEASNVKAYAATAAQGAKADSALQGISKGTDGSYITTNVSAKTNNVQTVSASLTIQDINTTDTDHRGLLEAWNTRNYIDNEIYKISLNFFFYGVQWDESNPSPDCTRIGNMSLHAELPVQNAIIGGLLQDDLTFTPFADQSDWSGETVDGSAGQLMLQIPKHYFKSEIHGTIHKKLISQYPLAGFIEIPLMYVSAEKATVDRTDPTTPKLCSVVNSSPEYRGGQNTADWDNTYRSLLGKPASNISLTNFRQYARNRGNGTAWNCHIYLAQRMLYWLFVTEYATLNSQKNFNAAKDANGYAQGGLGPGVSNWNGDAWNAYNSYNPLVPCGYLLEYGNQSAVKNYSVKDADDNILVTFEVNSYRGIQSPFGDIWDWTDGILINVQSDAAGGISTCYITDDPQKFSSTDFSQYTELGNTPRADNWIKTIFDNEQGDIICKTQGGSSTSYYCDYYWGANLPASDVSLRGVLFGGAANLGSRCGFLYASSSAVPGSVSPHLGSRLCAIPPP